MLSARWWTLVVWALAAAAALFWGLKLFVKAPPAPPHTQLADASGSARGDLTRLLGADAVQEAPPEAAEPAPDARFQLIGVVSPRSPQAAREGVALIAVDGKPPRAYRVGAVIEGQHVLQSVNARGATLGPRDGAPVVALNLAPPAPPTTGVPASLPTMPGGPSAGMPIPGAASPGTPMPGGLPPGMQMPAARIAPPLQQPMPPPAPPVPSLPRRTSQPASAPGMDPPPLAGVLPTQPIDPTQTR
ncbi:MAG TPA: type II secretion system protein N [Rubrivivax sp.]|nr:type II secretion system protein N [Rubrivivax sp.]